MIAFLKGHGLKGWQRNYKIYEKLDFIFRKQKTAVFLDGCFWHGHDCRNTRPAQNAEYWQKKRARNMARDVDVTEHLEKLDCDPHLGMRTEKEKSDGVMGENQ